MEYKHLSDLRPREFFKWFCDISKTPHGTGNEAPFIAFLEDYAAARGFYYKIDAAGNVYMRVPASLGYEGEPPFLFQAHMDMVCLKEPAMEFDFEREPLHLMIEGNKLYAQGTTLGADNAVGLATMLALGDSSLIPHPQLELLFTVEEECGLKGVRKFDTACIQSRRMISMDCGDSHVLCVSSAGRINGTIERQYQTEVIPHDHMGLKITLSGGQGGHSGLMIQKGHACAGNVMGELLYPETVAFSPRICSIQTDRKPILKECSAIVAFPQLYAQAAKLAIAERFEQIRTIYTDSDPGLRLDIAPCAITPHGLNAVDSAMVAVLLSLMHTGPYRMAEGDQSIVITSSALGMLELSNGFLRVNLGIRSLNGADIKLLYEKYVAIADMLGMKLAMQDQVQGWNEDPSSCLRARFDAAHQRLFGYGIKVERIQGCVETGILTAAIPGMDAVGIAPTSRGAHTTHECLYIDEVEPYWALLKAVLAQKNEA